MRNKRYKRAETLSDSFFGNFSVLVFTPPKLFYGTCGIYPLVNTRRMKFPLVPPLLLTFNWFLLCLHEIDFFKQKIYQIKKGNEFVPILHLNSPLFSLKKGFYALYYGYEDNQIIC